MLQKISRRKLLRSAAMAGSGLYVASLFPGCSSIGPHGSRVFRAGAHAADITPRVFPISVNGMMGDRSATKAYDRLNARCLVLDDGTTRLAIVVVDSLMIPGALME